MREIKFRGKTKSGKVYYGDVIHRPEYVAIVCNEKIHEVDPDSVAQFVGYDANGNEVYEGEQLILELPSILGEKKVLQETVRLAPVYDEPDGYSEPMTLEEWKKVGG